MQALAFVSLYVYLALATFVSRAGSSGAFRYFQFCLGFFILRFFLTVHQNVMRRSFSVFSIVSFLFSFFDCFLWVALAWATHRAPLALQPYLFATIIRFICLFFFLSLSLRCDATRQPVKSVRNSSIALVGQPIVSLRHALFAIFPFSPFFTGDCCTLSSRL